MISMRFYIILLFSLAFSFTLSASNLFTLNESSNVVATQNKDKTLGLFVSLDAYQNIVSEKRDNISIELPFFDRDINLELKRINVASKNLQIVSHSDNGSFTSDFRPNILSYKIYYLEKSIVYYQF